MFNICVHLWTYFMSTWDDIGQSKSGTLSDKDPTSTMCNIQTSYVSVYQVESTRFQINIRIQCISPGNESQLRILPVAGDIWRK